MSFAAKVFWVLGMYNMLTKTITALRYSTDKRGFHLVHMRAESRVLDISSQAYCPIVLEPRTAKLHLHMIYSCHLWCIELSLFWELYNHG